MDSQYLSPIIGLSLSEYIEDIQPLVKRKAPYNPRKNIKEIINRFIDGKYDHTLIIYKDSDWKGNIFETTDFTQSFREDLQSLVKTGNDEYRIFEYPKGFIWIPVSNYNYNPNATSEPVVKPYKKSDSSSNSNRINRIEDNDIRLQSHFLFDRKGLYKGSIKRFLKDFREHTDKKIRFQQRIYRPVNYCFGRDCSGHPIDSISFRLYINEKKLKDLIRKGNHRTIKNGDLITGLYNAVLCLFFINMSWDLTWEDLNLDNIMYLFLLLMNEVLDDEGEYQWLERGTDYLVRKFRGKLTDSLSYGFEHEISLMKKSEFVLSDNQCRFPKGWTIKEKNQWKKEQGIQRKESKPYKQRKEITEKRESVIQMKKDKVKVKDICKLNHISLSTYYKIISNIN